MSSDTIEEIHAIDVNKARAFIRRACDEASAEWVPRDAIADALLLEYMQQAALSTNRPQLVGRLERLVEMLKARPESRTLQ